MTDLAGHAVVSVARLPRVISAADSAAARAKAEALRAEIAKGAKFEDVARRESADTAVGRAGRRARQAAPHRRTSPRLRGGARYRSRSASSRRRC